MKKISKAVVLIIVILLMALFGYLLLGQHQTLSQSATDFSEIFVKKSGYYEFDNNQDTGLIMFTGAKVDPDAYSYLSEVKKANIYIIKSPFNMAFFNQNKASDIIKENSNVDNWYIGGHSLGGVVASMYAEKNPNIIEGVILLGSYPSQDISNSTNKYLSLVASNDQLVGNYDEHVADLPSSTKIIQIKGANHQQFGSYSKQKGDGKATISAEKQHDIVVKQINKFIN